MTFKVPIMRPEIIIHNSVSLDGSLTGFMPDMELHYKIAGDYKPEAHLIGADTIIAGNEMFGGGIPAETASDFEQPVRNTGLPWWIITDSRARLKGMLHSCRRFEFCRDVIVLLSESTPEDYISHLKERNYHFVKTGAVKADLESALNQLAVTHGIKKTVTDTGSILGNLLINSGMVKEISLLVHPLIVGPNCYPMFRDVKNI